MTVYKQLISAEKNSLNELKLNYLADIDVLEKICACSVAAKLNEDINPQDFNLLVVESNELFNYALSIGSGYVLAYCPTFIHVNNRIPVFDMIRSIRTIS